MAASGSQAVVVTVSDRGAAGVRPDTSGPLLVTGLRDLGWAVVGPVVVPDEVGAVRAAIGAAVAGGADLVVTTGGTGLAPRDITPEATAALLERPVPGIAEALRAYGVQRGVPTAVLSRGVAGLVGRTLVVNLPGSTGGVRDGLAVLVGLLPHVLDQVRGGDH